MLELCIVEEALLHRHDTLRACAGRAISLAERTTIFEVFDSNGFRYAYILVHGASPVTTERFAVQEQLYPWQAGASFECDDAELNRIFTAGIRTVQLNSHDAFIDCPTREQRAWVGDGVVHQMVHLATNRRLAAGLALSDAWQLAAPGWHAADERGGRDRGRRRRSPFPTGRCTGCMASTTATASAATGTRSRR